MTSSASYPAAAGASRNGASGLFIVAAAVMLLLGCFGPNAALTALAVLSFLLGAMLLWRPGQPPILLFVFLTQWLQASVAIFQATWAGVPVDDFSELHGSESTAIVLTQLALLVQAVGLKLGAGPIRMGVIAGARELAERVAIKQWFRAYLAFAGQSGWSEGLATLKSGFRANAAWILEGDPSQIYLAFLEDNYHVTNSFVFAFLNLKVLSDKEVMQPLWSNPSLSDENIHAFYSPFSAHSLKVKEVI